ncbi:MAG: radical SAM protein [Candidatus Aminicenantes bacterium]|nr:radical SAM protein [Candidatus Aminicenantes bacterium]
MKPNDCSLLKQIFSIALGKEKYIIYAPLKGIAFVANPRLVNEIFEYAQQLDSSRLSSPRTPSNPSYSKKKFLEGSDFLNSLSFFQAEPLPVDKYQDNGTQYDAVVLFLTNQCNLGCLYCYASSGEYAAKRMTWEIARESINYVTEEVIRNQSPEMTLGFHGGGEPSLNWDILTRAADYAHSLATKNDFALKVSGSFNGYWSRKMLDYIIQNFTELSLSFDGLPAIQNQQRPTKNGNDSFPRVVETLHSLDEAGFPYGIRMTVTNRSVHRLEESISFVCEQFRPNKIQVEPVFMEGRAKKNRAEVSDLDLFIDQFIKGLRRAEEEGIHLFYSGARLDALTQRFCMAACRAFVVTPEGDVTTCFETYGRDHPLGDQFIVGRFRRDAGFSLHKKKIEDHFNRTVEDISYCEGCFCRWHCAGDCAIKTYSEETPEGFQPTRRCYLNQELTKFLLLKNIKESQGLVWISNRIND